MPQKITVDQFLSYLSSGDASILKATSDVGYILNEPLTISDQEIYASFFENFHFTQGITFTNCTFKKFTVFKKTRTLKTLRFKDCKSEMPNTDNPGPGLQIEDPELNILVFEKCKFDNGLKIKASEKSRSSTVQHKIKTLEILDSKCDGLGVSISGVIIEKWLTIKNVSSDSEIELRSLFVNGSISISSLNSKGLSFSGPFEIEKTVQLNESTVDFLLIDNTLVKASLTIKNSEILNHLSIKNAIVKGKTEIEFKKTSDYSLTENFEKFPPKPSVEIEYSEFNDGFSCNGGNHTFKKLQINFSGSLKGRLIFSNSNFERLILTGVNSENNVFFRNIGLSAVNILDFLNLKSLSFSNLNSSFTKSQDSVFQILDSDLGNWELANFDFDSFAKIIWRDSQITGLRTSAVSWFKDRKLEAEGENDPSTCFRRREFYRQLKQASEKQGDRINELEFKRREIKAYRKGLKIRKENRWDRFTIWTGGSNNHGQSWGKALGLIIAFTLVFFYPLIISCVDPELTFWPINSNWKGFGFFWDKYKQYSDSIPELFNPTRRTDILYKDPTNLGWLRFWDGFHRILLAFFIFQIVSAFRKFVK